eukprot:COSAG02_NODE_30692_length_546_cov_90.829978_1_plen_98_part_01
MRPCMPEHILITCMAACGRPAGVDSRMNYDKRIYPVPPPVQTKSPPACGAQWWITGPSRERTGEGQGGGTILVGEHGSYGLGDGRGHAGGVRAEQASE